MKKFLDLSLADYRGEGWYIDNSSYDYYSMWAYQMYGLLWSEYFGKENYPEYAKRFIDNFKEMTGTYPLMFGRNGQMIMWGRSITYRFAAVSPFSLAGYMNDDSVNYGHLRRIASGTLLQFLQNPNLLADGVPTLGFYGAFEPAIQGYSCRGSVCLDGKSFLSLLLPESNPFGRLRKMKAFGVRKIGRIRLKTHSRTVQRFSSQTIWKAVSAKFVPQRRCRPMRVKIGDIRKTITGCLIAVNFHGWQMERMAKWQ